MRVQKEILFSAVTLQEEVNGRNYYRRAKWSLRAKFKIETSLFAFLIAWLIFTLSTYLDLFYDIEVRESLILYIYIYIWEQFFEMVFRLGGFLWHINHYSLLNGKSSLNIYILYVI